jgi:hypothetical protein
MTSGYGAQNRELRDRFMQAVYDLAGPDAGIAQIVQIMERIGLDPENFEDEKRCKRTARHLHQLNYIRKVSDGYTMVAITPEGTQYVEGDLEQPAASNVTFHIGTADRSIIGT